MSKACAFIGDNYIPEFISIERSLNEAVFDSIEKKAADTFYLFEGRPYQEKCLNVLLDAKKKYPNIKIIIVVNRLIMVKYIQNRELYDDVIVTNRNIYDENFHDVDYHFKWAIDNSDIIIVNAPRPEYKFKNYIENNTKEKEVIRLKAQHKPL